MKQMELTNPIDAANTRLGQFDTNGWVVFFLICVTLLAMAFIQQKMVLTDQVQINTWSQQLAYDRIEALLELRSKWLWLSYAVTPLLILLQVFFVAVCLTTGALFSNIPGNFRFFFGLVLRCYPVLMLNGIIILFAALLFKEINTLDDFQRLDYLSAAAWINTTDVTAWYLYPLKVVNVVEILFWVALSWGLSRYAGRSLFTNFKFVARSYGVGLLLWILVIMFLQLNLA